MEKNEQQTIPQIIEEVKMAICDNYCKYPDILPEEVLYGECEKCPLGRLG